MPKNIELIDTIAELSRIVGREYTLAEDATNVQLLEVVACLKIEVQIIELAAEVGAEAVAPEIAELIGKGEASLKQLQAALAAVQATQRTQDAKKAVKAKKAGHVVAPGKAISCTKTRILSAGNEITAEDLAGGEKAFQAFIKSEHIVKA